MGQYRSYKEMSLERQIADLEREVQAYKSRQIYSSDQIRFFASNNQVTISSRTNSPLWSDTSSYIYGIATVVGENKSKILTGVLTYGWVSGDNQGNVDTYLELSRAYGSSQDWFVISTRQGTTPSTYDDRSPYSIQLGYRGNMKVGVFFSWLT